MRYIINDDDLEDWYKRLKKVTEVISAGENEGHDQLNYVLSEMEVYISEQIDLKKLSDK